MNPIHSPILTTFLCMIVLGFAVQPSEVSAEPGRIVVSHDVNTLATNTAGVLEAKFAVNVATWLTGMEGGTILAIESSPEDPERNFAQSVKNALSDAGFNVFYESDPKTVKGWSLKDLEPYQALFVGITWPNAAFIDGEVLTQYVNGGGNVYIYGGVGKKAASEAHYLNSFVSSFGLNYENGYNEFTSVPITQTHPIFSGITGKDLHNGNGQSIIATGTNPSAEIIQTVEDQGVYAVVNPPTVSSALDDPLFTDVSIRSRTYDDESGR